MRKTSTGLVTLCAMFGLLVGCTTPAPARTLVPPTKPPSTPVPPTAVPEVKLILGTTTSTNDSGLLENILPGFEATSGANVEVIAVGTGQALKLGEDGNADVLLVHARAREDAFMEAGHGVRREDVMYNDFVIVGPADDPAGIKGKKNAAKAFQMIADAGAKFVSRGDDSGTHTKEKAIWTAAGVEPSGDWYISAGQGMGAVLTMANEQLACTLSDRATYLARKAEGLDLEILAEGDEILSNPYGVMAVNPAKNDQINIELANQFIDWLICLEVQQEIAQYGKDLFGMPMFYPDSEPYRAAGPAPAALKITGEVDQRTAWAEDEVKAMPSMEAVRANKEGQPETYTGVSIASLLSVAVPKAGATVVVYVADNGDSAEVALADALACDNCIFSFRRNGGFSVIMPGFPDNVQVKGVIEIQVK